MKRTGPTAFERRELSLAMMVDERTLERALRGEPVRVLSLERIRRVLAERKLLHLLPAEARQ